MKKAGIYIFIVGIVGLIGFLLWNGVFFSSASSLQKVREKATVINNVFINDIQSLKATAVVLDKTSKILRKKLLYIKFPDQWRSEEEDVWREGESLFIRNKNAKYFNKKFIMQSGIDIALYNALAINRPDMVFLAEESGFGIWRWNKCFKASFLMQDGFKIKGYLDYKSFKWIKIEYFFISPQGQWHKRIENNYIEFENIKGVWLPTLSSCILYDYSKEGKQQREGTWKSLSREVNVDIDKSLFNIPQKS
ncbi:MAG: hypothetical protein KKH94_05840 [Candidatus Omnitrophica bacterium]|nr:hypothetical protein [Candidatus Omnitrophota bacterium]